MLDFNIVLHLIVPPAILMGLIPKSLRLANGTGRDFLFVG